MLLYIFLTEKVLEIGLYAGVKVYNIAYWLIYGKTETELERIEKLEQMLKEINIEMIEMKKSKLETTKHE